MRSGIEVRSTNPGLLIKEILRVENGVFFLFKAKPALLKRRNMQNYRRLTNHVYREQISTKINQVKFKSKKGT
jgi:hypothetical protein